MKKFVIILVLIPFLQGCAVGLLAAGIGYGVGQGRKASAQMLEAKGQYVSRYDTFKVEMEKINLEREKAKLTPQPIPTFEEWLNEQPMSASEIKLFQKYKVITAKDLKEQK